MIKVYDFTCKDCGHTFERFVKDISDVECPYCGSKDVEKGVSAGSIKATGMGVYDRKMRV